VTKRNYSDEALYLRMRLLRLHNFNRIIYPKKTWKRMEECLIEKTSAQNVKDTGRVVLPKTYTEEAAREAEFELVSVNGSELYADAALLKRHVEETLFRWRVKLMMHSIYRSCGYREPSTDADLMYEAALDAGKLTPEELR
jgi:hypothetical protein